MEDKTNLIDRPRYLNRIMPFVDEDVIKVLVGLRRAGESDMLRLIQRRLIERGVSSLAIHIVEFRGSRADRIA